MPVQPYAVNTLVDEPFHDRVSARWLVAVAQGVLASEVVPTPAEVGVRVTDDPTVRRLNRRFLGEDAPTDVLAFPMEERAGAGAGFVPPPDGVRHLGEVVISYPTAQRQAREAGHPVERELAWLLAHGVLHLLGYDHAEPEEERRMRERAEVALARV